MRSHFEILQLKMLEREYNSMHWTSNLKLFKFEFQTVACYNSARLFHDHAPIWWASSWIDDTETRWKLFLSKEWSLWILFIEETQLFHFESWNWKLLKEVWTRWCFSRQIKPNSKEMDLFRTYFYEGCASQLTGTLEGHRLGL